ncbi:multiple epidermal growth factor-like domains protein 10 isoform X3 [Mercenaria mercenaria]|uniref:multiple epidermal growth factor-like domains protein 10 isoform X3 n=1 Tax=Mercenaria mercenaria TaxID=6596 RepID=UPI00234F530D|nr:multiple epidermal growth factor-like domains protein 10 isoform X3 [Mercenaria mercenaria]
MENIQFVRFLTFIYWIQRIICQCPNTVHPGIKGFGPNCKYRCNCKDNVQCNVVTGECPDGCLFGWMGPGCQYRNLVTTSNGTKQNYREQDKARWAKKAIDGDVNTCSSTGYNKEPGNPTQQFWRLKLSTKFYIVGLVIKIRDSDKANFQGFSVEIKNTTNNYEVCYQHGAGTEGESVMNVNCVKPIIGKIVKIKLKENMPSPLVLCEVELFGGRLVSFNRLTSIETVLTYNGIWKASYAVDGRPMLSPSESQNSEPKRTCSATMDYTSEPAKWWNVHLDTFYDIQGIRFFGRLDHGTSQYNSYKVLVGNNSSQTKLIFTDNGSEDKKQGYNPKSRNFTGPFLGSTVRVERSAKILVICEFEVFAECPLGRCGWECNETCQCRSQTTGQHKIEGMCPYGCSGRWSGQNGKCNIECNDGNFGQDCNFKCGQCQHDAACNKENGRCVSGCKPGYKLPFCIQTCDPGWYGAKCSTQCGSCKHGETCNNTNGECTSGCSPGWLTSMCNKLCEHGWYGMDCSKPCGSCKDGDTCNNTNGECTRGCNPGWLTSMCNIPCASGFYGDGCNETCGHCLNDEICSHENGLCLHGCASGYHGTVCKTECNDGNFGEDCNSACGQCKNDSVCNKETGRCVFGCKPGYKLPLCIQKCNDGNFGEDCNSTCGQCKNDSVCNKETGKCVFGCKPGYKLPLCIQKCEEGMYGENCVTKCGSCAGNEHCNRTTGTCPHGCIPDYKGILCNVRATEGGSENGSSTGLDAIIVVLVLVIVGVVIGIIVRRKLKRDTRNSAANGSPKTSDQNITVINGPAQKADVVPKPNQDPLYRNTVEKEPIDENSIKISHLRTLRSSA